MIFKKRDNYLIGIFFLAVAAFFVYASVYWSLRPSTVGSEMWIFNTPDETANYFFINRFVETGQLSSPEPLNFISGELNLVHPRSTTVIDNQIVPGTFLGFIFIMRAVAGIFGSGFIPFIVPFFSIFAIVCFYLLVKEIFCQRVAFYSALLLILMPAFWYYNSRSLFNNVLFVDFLIIGFYFLIRFFRGRDLIGLAVSALIIGLAAAIRTNDLIWLVPLVLMVFWFNRQRASLNYLWLFGFIFVLALAPVLLYQYQLYGGWLKSGYLPAAGPAGEENIFSRLMTMAFLPFGFNLKNIFLTFFHYYVKMFWWNFILLVAALILIGWQWRRQKLNRKIKAYLFIWFLISLIIAVYYGSWWFYNNLMAKPLIGSSQTRYLLPFYLFSLPLAAYFLSWFFGLFKIRRPIIINILVFSLIIYFSVQAVLFKGEENLLAVKATVLDYYRINRLVTDLTESEAIIISSYHDKVFFPQRRVIFYWQEPRYLDNISRLAAVVPIYFYSINPAADENYFREYSDLKPVLLAAINERESFYQLTIE